MCMFLMSWQAKTSLRSQGSWDKQARGIRTLSTGRESRQHTCSPVNPPDIMTADPHNDDLLETDSRQPLDYTPKPYAHLVVLGSPSFSGLSKSLLLLSCSSLSCCCSSLVCSGVLLIVGNPVRTGCLYCWALGFQLVPVLSRPLLLSHIKLSSKQVSGTKLPFTGQILTTG